MKKIDLKKNIQKTISNLNIKRNSTLYVAGNLYNFGIRYNEINNFCDIFAKELKKKIGINGNIIVPTATLNFTNSNRIYFPDKTKSYMMGIFSEYIRNQSESFRSSHPLWSFSGIGKMLKKF